MISIKKIYKCFFNSVIDLIKHDGIEYAGYLSFLLMLSILPFVFFLTTMLTFLGINKLNEVIVLLLEKNYISNIIVFFKPGIDELLTKPPTSLVTFTILSSIWTSLSFFEAIKISLNRAYRAIDSRSYIIKKITSFLEFFCIIILTIIVVLTLTTIPIIKEYLKNYFVINTYIFGNENYFLRKIIITIYSFIVITSVYCFIPNKKSTLLNQTPGTFIVILSSIVLIRLFNFYIKTFTQLSIIYGSITSVIVALLFFYFTSIIFIFGAEFNYNITLNFFKNKN